MKLLILFLGCALVSASMSPSILRYFQPSHNLPILNAFASKNGTVKVFDSKTGSTTIDVDFSSPAFRKENKDFFPYNAQMKIALYTSETVLFSAKTIIGFILFDCDDERTGCTRDKESPEVDLSFPQFNASGTRASVNLVIDYQYWNQDAEIVLATSGSKKNTNLNYTGTYGIVGMGIEGKAYGNLKETNIFSIFFDESGNGRLYFWQNFDFVREPAPLAVLTTNTNWHTQYLNRFCLGQSCNWIPEQETYSLIFDVNSDLIRLPEAVYSQLLENYLKEYGINCDPSPKYSRCSYNGLIKRLPSIIFEFGHQKVVIPPQFYVQNGNDETLQTKVTLLFATITDQEDQPDFYFTPEFENCIVLGQPFMRNYYTVFNKQKQTISIYNNNYGPAYYHEETFGPRSYKIWIYIIGPTFVVISIIIFCCWKRQRNKKIRKGELKTRLNKIPVAQEVGTVNDTSQVPDSSRYDETLPQVS